MPATGVPKLGPFTSLIRQAAMTAYIHLLPEGAQRTARRNAYESVAADRLRARDRAEASAALEFAKPVPVVSARPA